MQSYARFLPALVAAALALAVPAGAHGLASSAVVVADQQSPAPKTQDQSKPPNTGSAARPPAQTPPKQPAPKPPPNHTMRPAPVHTMRPAPVHTAKPAPVRTAKPAPDRTMKPPIETMKPRPTPAPTKRPAPKPTPKPLPNPTRRPGERPTPRPAVNPWHPNRNPYWRAPAPGWRRPAWANAPRPSWYHTTVYRTNYVLVNPRPYASNWAWNGGYQWYPQTNYWGGGFWGPFAAVSLMAGQAIWNQNRYVQPSYAYPGWYMYQNYGLQPVACGPQNLVYIYGPNNGVMCAYPNQYVMGGVYYVDPASLQLYVM